MLTTQNSLKSFLEPSFKKASIQTSWFKLFLSLRQKSCQVMNLCSNLLQNFYVIVVYAFVVRLYPKHLNLIHPIEKSVLEQKPGYHKCSHTCENPGCL